MNPPRDSRPSLAPAPSRDFPALRRVLPFTLPYRMRMAGAMLTLLVASALFSSIFWKFRSSSLACSAKFSWIGLGVREIFGDDRNFDHE
jgi:hypothetical protein